MKKLVWFAALALHAPTALATDSWECKDVKSWDWSSIVATVNGATRSRSAAVSMLGKTFNTAYEIDGFMRRWDWGYTDGRGFRYSFILNADDSAALYDFGSSGNGKGYPKLQLHCRQKTRG